MMEKLRQVFTFSTTRLTNPLYLVPFAQVSPELAQVMDTMLYYLFTLALGVTAVAYWGILEFTKGLSKAYKILLVLIIATSAMMFAWSFFDARITNIMLPVWVTLIGLSAITRLIRLWRGQDPEDLALNKRTWQVVMVILVSVMVVSVGAAINSLLRGGPDTLHYLAQSQRRQEKVIQQVVQSSEQQKQETKQVNAKTDQVVVGLTLSLANQAEMLVALKRATEENEKLKKQLAATRQVINRTAETVTTVQRNQEQTQAEVKAVVDTVKAVVAAVLPDSVARDSIKPKPVTPGDSVRKKRGWWPFRKEED